MLSCIETADLIEIPVGCVHRMTFGGVSMHGDVAFG